MSKQKYNLLTEDGILLTNGEIISSGPVVEFAREVESTATKIREDEKSGRVSQLDYDGFKKYDDQLTKDDLLLLKKTDVPSLGQHKGGYMDSVIDLLCEIDHKMTPGYFT